VTLMVLSLVMAFCFALAAICWAVWSLREQAVNERWRSFLAMGASVVTTLIVGGYMLILAGVIRLK